MDAKADVRELAHKFEFLNDTQKSKVRSFCRAFKRQYPKTWRARIAIESCLFEKAGERVLCSNLKDLKKYALFLVKLHM